MPRSICTSVPTEVARTFDSLLVSRSSPWGRTTFSSCSVLPWASFLLRLLSPRWRSRCGVDCGSALDLQANVCISLPLWGCGRNLATIAGASVPVSVFATMCVPVVVFSSPLISHQWAPSRRIHVVAAFIWSVVVMLMVFAQSYLSA